MSRSRREDRITVTLFLLSMVAVPASLAAMCITVLAWNEFSGRGLLNRAVLMLSPAYAITCIAAVHFCNGAGRRKAAEAGLALLALPIALLVLFFAFIMFSAS